MEYLRCHYSVGCQYPIDRDAGCKVTMNCLRKLHQTLTSSSSQICLWLLALCLCSPFCAYGQAKEQSKPNGNSQKSEAERNSLTAQEFNLQQNQSTPSISSRQAAVIAKQHAGGKVLRVHTTADGHRIKMLLPSGKVTYIFVGEDGQIEEN